MLNIQTFQVNPLQENCYVVSDETKECVIIDCGALTTSEQKTIIDYIKKEELSPVHNLGTHGPSLWRRSTSDSFQPST